MTWYLVHTKPANEGKAEENLQRQGFRVYLPRLRKPKLLRGRWTERIEPLFPRYLFLELQVGEQALSPVRSTLGVASVVRFGSSYAEVPEALIEALRLRADPDSGLHRIGGRTPFALGDRVVVAAGPLEGLEGVFQRESGDERVVLLLDMLGQDTPVRIDAGLVLPKT